MMTEDSPDSGSEETESTGAESPRETGPTSRDVVEEGTPPEGTGSTTNVTAQPAGQAVNVQVNVGQPNVVIVQPSSGQSLLIRAVWFVFIGWWVGWFWAMTAWVLNMTIIGLPVGILMMNRLSAVATLKRTKRTLSATVEGGQVTLVETGPEQQVWWIRAIFFVLVGWWLSFLWINVAYVLMLTIIGIPIAFTMFDYVAAVTTLRRLS
jgi:uncharacterized membrane protein YccF (DUF307 family)